DNLVIFGRESVDAGTQQRPAREIKRLGALSQETVFELIQTGFLIEMAQISELPGKLRRVRDNLKRYSYCRWTLKSGTQDFMCSDNISERTFKDLRSEVSIDGDRGHDLKCMGCRNLLKRPKVSLLRRKAKPFDLIW